MAFITVALAALFPVVLYVALEVGIEGGYVANLFMLCAILLVLAAYLLIMPNQGAHRR